MSPANSIIIVNVSYGSNPRNTNNSNSLNLNSEIKKECEVILQQYKKGEVLQAHHEVNKLLEKYPNSLPVKQLNVLILYKDKKYEEAYEKIKEVLKSCPKHVAMINLQGLIQRQLALFDEAIESYLLAIKLKPEFADPL